MKEAQKELHKTHSKTLGASLCIFINIFESISFIGFIGQFSPFSTMAIDMPKEEKILINSKINMLQVIGNIYSSVLPRSFFIIYLYFSRGC